jgi:hypothetical protein
MLGREPAFPSPSDMLTHERQLILAARSSLASPPHVGKEMLGLISLMNFA